MICNNDPLEVLIHRKLGQEDSRVLAHFLSLISADADQRHDQLLQIYGALREDRDELRQTRADKDVVVPLLVLE